MINIIILAAGDGKRMKSDLPKILHKIANWPMLDIVIDKINNLSNQINLITVVSENLIEKISPEKKEKYNFVIQNPRLGTGHAVKIAIESEYFNSNFEKTLILYADTPLIHKETIEKLISIEDFAFCILGFKVMDKSKKYGRIFLSQDIKYGLDSVVEINSIKEFKDFQENEQMPEVCNSGIMLCKTKNLLELINKIDNKNAANEYYLTDLIQIAKSEKLNCGMIFCQEDEVLGANSMQELAIVERKMQEFLINSHLENGVCIKDPNSVYLSYDTIIGNNCIIEQNVFIGNNVFIGDSCAIKAFSYLEGVKIHSGCQIGPFVRIRSQTVLHEDVKIGNFVEVKNSTLGSKTKANHLSYIGDAEIGEEVNFGVGSVICNFDGINKHKTKIGKNVFIGANSCIIAPCEIQEKSFIAAGSVITMLVEKFDLAIARTRQINIKNWFIKKGFDKK